MTFQSKRGSSNVVKLNLRTTKMTTEALSTERQHLKRYFTTQFVLVDTRNHSTIAHCYNMVLVGCRGPCCLQCLPSVGCLESFGKILMAWMVLLAPQGLALERALALPVERVHVQHLRVQ